MLICHPTHDNSNSEFIVAIPEPVRLMNIMHSHMRIVLCAKIAIYNFFDKKYN